MWRLVDSSLLEPAMSAAVDESILIARSEGRVPNTLHLYRRDRPTVSLGHFERVAECVNMDEVQRRDIAVVRRLSGGSAIYTDQGQVIYTLVVDGRDVPESPQDAFRMLCQGIVGALGELGLAAEFKPVNDVLVRGRKISGSAQSRRHGTVIQHGTLLVRNDYECMFKVLGSSKRTKEEMTSLTEELGVPPSIESIMEALAKGFSGTLDVEMVKGELTELEWTTANDLVRTRYGSREHTFHY
jgi:lipoate-protein ligase A